MSHTLPKRHRVSPFRQNSNGHFDSYMSENDQVKKKQPLRIMTDQLNSTTVPHSPSGVRQRLSSLFRTSSPVMTSLKDTFANNRSSPNLADWNKSNAGKRASTLSLFKVKEEPQDIVSPISEDDKSSTSCSVSSDNSDHMPASPTYQHDQLDDWQVVGVPYSTFSLNKHIEPSLELKKPNTISLAYHVQQILGSTIDEVDEEIDQDWEDSRKRLRQSLQLNKKDFYLRTTI